MSLPVIRSLLIAGCTLLPFSTANAFNFEALVGAAVKTATEEVGKAITGSPLPVSGATAAQSNPIENLISSVTGASSVNTSRPANWPSRYRWYAYDRTAPQPTNTGRVHTAKIPGWVDGLQFNSLPFQHAIVRVHGDGSRKMAIFSDPYCPYTKRQEEDLNKLNDVTIYTFVAPFLSTNSEPMVRKIVCQPTNQARAQAWDNWILNGVEPPSAPDCSTPSSKIIASMRGLKSHHGSYYNQVSPVLVFNNNITSTAIEQHHLLEIIDLKIQ